MAKIHPTAIVDGSAKLADGVAVGPLCIVEGDVEVGPGTVLRQNVVVRRYTAMGSNNRVDAFAVLGGEPQDVKFDLDTVSYLRIGDDNVFREGVTISRATTPGGATTVGSGTYWMANSHAGHDAAVADGAIITNGVLVAGHAVIGRRAVLSGCAMVHQFTWVGEMVMCQGGAIVTQHVPPFVMVVVPSCVVGLNTVGLRRAEDITDEDRRQIREAFGITYRSKLTPPQALEKMDACGDWGAPAGRFREFIRKVIAAEPPYNRGLCPMRGRRQPADRT